MQPALIVDSLAREHSETRRRLATELGVALQQATIDPARMLPLWTAFSRGEAVPAEQLRSALSATFVEDALKHQLLVRVDVGDPQPWVRSTICVVAAEVGGQLLWVASDFGWYDDHADAVSGPSEASHTLLAAVPPGVRGSILDMGCGSGAVGTYLAQTHQAQLTSADVNPRALALTELTAALNDVHTHTVRSDFAASVEGVFDLVVCNPPFVLRRPDVRTTFRDSNDPLGHALLARDLVPLLTRDGLALYLTNWEYRLDGDDPLDALGAALAHTENADILVLERAVVPVQQYIGLWTDEPYLGARWNAAFDADEVAHVGTGLVVVRPRVNGPSTVSITRSYDTPRADLSQVVAQWRRPQ